MNNESRPNEAQTNGKRKRVLFSSLRTLRCVLAVILMGLVLNQFASIRPNKHNNNELLHTRSTVDASSKTYQIQTTSVAADYNNNTMMFQLPKKFAFVQYNACCGLGHRLARMAKAYNLAKRLNWGFISRWEPFCGDMEMHSYMFGGGLPIFPGRTIEKHKNGTATVTVTVTETDRYIFVPNETPTYTHFNRTGKGVNDCPCRQNEIDSDYEFYSSLMERFHRKNDVYKFMEQHSFNNYTVIGMHVRAGNGEKGDFEDKKRGINNHTEFVERLSAHVIQLYNDSVVMEAYALYNQQHTASATSSAKPTLFVPPPPPLLFIATDTISIANMLRERLNGIMKVIDLPQQRVKEGEGILISQNFDRQSSETCIMGWEQAVMDMMLLAHSDIVLATSYSSFVQTMPMSIVLGRNKERKIDAMTNPNTATDNKRRTNINIRKPYCELTPDVEELICIESFMEWCCDKSTLHIGYEVLRMLHPSFWDNPVDEYNFRLVNSTTNTQING